MTNKKWTVVLILSVVGAALLSALLTLTIVKLSDGDSENTPVRKYTSARTEKANESRDAANIRAAISEVTVEGLSNNKNVSKTVELTQTGDFEYVVDDIGGEPVSTFANKTSITVTYNATSGEVTFN